jgi:hypothetical protein
VRQTGDRCQSLPHCQINFASSNLYPYLITPSAPEILNVVIKYKWYGDIVIDFVLDISEIGFLKRGMLDAIWRRSTKLFPMCLEDLFEV